MDIVLQRNRLCYLASLLRSPAVHLRALLAVRTPDGLRQPWVETVLKGMEELYQWFPIKLAELGNPLTHPDAWQRFICSHPAAWKQLVKLWADQTTACGYNSCRQERKPSQHTVEGGTLARQMICETCGAGFSSSRALQTHERAKHGKRCEARHFADSDGRCPICFKVFPSRLRLMAHLTEKRARRGKNPCRESLYKARRLSDHRVAELDAIDKVGERPRNAKANSSPQSAGANVG